MIVAALQDSNGGHRQAVVAQTNRLDAQGREIAMKKSVFRTATLIALGGALLALASSTAGAAMITPFTDPAGLTSPVIVDDFGPPYESGLSSISISGLTITGLNGTTMRANSWDGNMQPNTRVGSASDPVEDVQLALLIAFPSAVNAFGWTVMGFNGDLEFFSDAAATLSIASAVSLGGGFNGYRSDEPFLSVITRGYYFLQDDMETVMSPSWQVSDLRYEVAPTVPEPSTAILLLCGGVGLALMRKVRRHRGE
jgi:hypothetical protein